MVGLPDYRTDYTQKRATGWVWKILVLGTPWVRYSRAFVFGEGGLKLGSFVSLSKGHSSFWEGQHFLFGIKWTKMVGNWVTGVIRHSQGG